MKAYILSLALLLIAGVAGTERVQAQNSSLSLDDCLKLFDLEVLDYEERLETMLKNKGFVKTEINEDEMDYDHFYRFTSKKDGTVIEIYGEYCDTGSTDYMDIYFPTPSEAFCFAPDEDDRKWKMDPKSEYDNSKYTHKNGVIMKRLGRLVEFKNDRLRESPLSLKSSYIINCVL